MEDKVDVHYKCPEDYCRGGIVFEGIDENGKNSYRCCLCLKMFEKVGGLYKEVTKGGMDG